MRLGVVVPVLDEEVALGPVLHCTRRLLADGDLLVVSDGGSADRTVAIAESFGARVVRGVAGRGRQLQAGAREALRHGVDA
jgi:glycosyltransferase involved in cell wall biosynthesis